MRLSAWLPLAALSAAAIAAATRPHYGGTLRVEMHGTPAALDDPAEPLGTMVYETLVRLDERGAPKPCLAVSWQHDSAAKRWQFTLRPQVKLQDGSPLTPATAAAALGAVLPGAVVAATPNGVTVRGSRPMPDLLLELAHTGRLQAGPFRVTAFEAGKRASLAANEDYWGGRPYLDTIAVEFGRALRDQLADLELGKADVVEVGPADLRRASDHGRAVWSSAPATLITLIFASGRSEDPRLREALALAIDRAAMFAVLLQRQGEISAALLPQWLSGYAFAFPSDPDLARARELAASLPPANRRLSLTYDPAMRIARSLAERVAVNARDAGLTVDVSPQNPRGDVRLVEVRLTSLAPVRALDGIAAALGLPEPSVPDDSAAAIYESERHLLDVFGVIPLFHVPVFYAAGSRVHVHGPLPITRLGDWRFDDVWLSVTAP